MNDEEFIIKFYACDNQEQFLKDVNHNLNCLQNQVEKLTQENNDLESKYESKNDEYIKSILKISDLQEEIEELKPIIDDLNIKLDIRNKEKSRICNQVINYRDKGKRKAKEITNLLALYKKTREEKQHLQSVIDKAINYIENDLQSFYIVLSIKLY